MILLRSSADFPAQIEELKLTYSSKELALHSINADIEYLRKLKVYRQYTEADVAFERAVILIIQFKAEVNKIPEWKPADPVELKWYQAVYKFIVRPISKKAKLKNGEFK